jgi:MoxR-like ATPase
MRSIEHQKNKPHLLEAMQERSVTIAGENHKLDVFCASYQNPIEQEGTYPLPEAH